MTLMSVLEAQSFKSVITLNSILLLQDVFDDRSQKMVEVMDKCEKAIAEVHILSWRCINVGTK